MSFRLFTISIALFYAQSLAIDIGEQYSKCRAEGFGNESLVCDLEHRLSERTTAKLTYLLSELKNSVPCKCEKGCKDEEGHGGYLGLLMIIDSKNSKSLAQDSKQIYENAGMTSDGCDHGLLLIYLRDTQQIATYRGGDSFVVLTDEDTKKIHELASKSSDGGEAVALQYLLQNYKDVAEPTITRADSWMPIVGLIVALLIFLLILAILIALFLSRFCCCCYKNKKEMYQVNTIPTYKTIEPLYVAAPSFQNERFPMHPNDTIYSTPYSGSPLPYPPPPGTSRPITPSSMIRPTRVVPSGFNNGKQTPSDPPSPRTQRRRERGEVAEKKPTPIPPSILNEKSPKSSPSETQSMKARRTVERGEMAIKSSPIPVESPPHINSQSLTTDEKPTSLRRNHLETGYQESSIAGDSATYALPPDGSLYSASTLPHPMHRDVYLPSISEAYGTIPRPWISPPIRGGIEEPQPTILHRASMTSEGDLPFLDPKRKVEVQTREDFIY